MYPGWGKSELHIFLTIMKARRKQGYFYHNFVILDVSQLLKTHLIKMYYAPSSYFFKLNN